MPIKAKLIDNEGWYVMDIEINQDGSQVIIKTSDGFVFYLQEDGKVVDSLNPELVDMSWLSFNSFLLSQL
ncbi:MAG: hypothetical protein CMC15_17745 [Flavobacteriaceae bacterium]|nr:hypothetical protein [Flavobacteriaceae bacterium]|tara:strand:- start:2 stop:211 length:210 start_codon:yes stop_codon:yes gene_type:complete